MLQLFTINPVLKAEYQLLHIAAKIQISASHIQSPLWFLVAKSTAGNTFRKNHFQQADKDSAHNLSCCKLKSLH